MSDTMDANNDLKKKGTWFEAIGSFGFAILIAMTIRWAFIEAYVIPSGSMLPSLLIHDHIFVNKLVYGIRLPFGKTWLTKFSEPSRNDIIVFRYPENESIFYIKRVVGVPGDKVFYENGELYINDKKIDKAPPRNNWDWDWVRDSEMSGGKEDYEFFEEKLGEDAHSTLQRKEFSHVGFGPSVIPENSLYVMGDNRDNSHDSRFWGMVPKENVLGRAMFVWLSCEETLPGVSFFCNPLTVRWGRFFHPIR